MSINNIVNTKKNSDNVEAITKEDLIHYIAPYRGYDNAPVRVFSMDGGRTPTLLDGFIYLNGNNFNVRLHSWVDKTYTLQPEDIIGITETNKLGYERRRFV